MPTRIYEAYVEGDGGQRFFFLSRRKRDQFAFTGEADGDFCGCVHEDLESFLGKMAYKIHEQACAIEEAGMKAVSLLPMVEGKLNPSAYTYEDKRMHNWIASNCYEAKYLYGMEYI